MPVPVDTVAMAALIGLFYTGLTVWRAGRGGTVSEQKLLNDMLVAENTRLRAERDELYDRLADCETRERLHFQRAHPIEWGGRQA